MNGNCKMKKKPLYLERISIVAFLICAEGTSQAEMFTC